MKGNPCEYCGEEVIPGEGPQDLHFHQECLLRMISGSVAHIRKECSCFVPGSSEGDPPGMTLREGAKAALAEWHKTYPV